LARSSKSDEAALEVFHQFWAQSVEFASINL
jgi:hypothetical protein